MIQHPSKLSLILVMILCYFISLKDVVLTVVFFNNFVESKSIFDISLCIGFLILSIVFGNLGKKFQNQID